MNKIKFDPNAPKIKQMKVFLSNKCSLQCNHCLNSKINIETKESNIDDIIRRIDFILEMGVEYIELGILIGDALEFDVQKFRMVIEYLDNNPLVKGISISTSFLFFSQSHLDIFNTTNKLAIQISWYGYNNETYQNKTNIRNGFSKLFNNVQMLSKLNTKIEITLINMFGDNIFIDSDYYLDNVLLNYFNETLINNKNIEFFHDTNSTETIWENMLSNDNVSNIKNRKGACTYLFFDTGIDSQDDVLACAWFDFNKLLQLGNIKIDSPITILENHKKLVREQNMGIFRGPCRNCLVYKSIIEGKK